MVVHLLRFKNALRGVFYYHASHTGVVIMNIGLQLCAKIGFAHDKVYNARTFTRGVRLCLL